MISAADSYDEIRARMIEIQQERMPMCPILAGRTLYDCLHSPGQCGENCPRRDDWVGPDKTRGIADVVG